MARHRRSRKKKKQLSGLGALALDPKVLIGLGLIVAVGAYFLLMPKDADAAVPVPPSGDGLVPPPSGEPLPTDTGSGTPATPPIPVTPQIPAGPVLTNLIQKTEGRGQNLISIPGLTTGSSTGTAATINKLRSSGIFPR